LLRATDDGLAFRHALTRDAILATIAPMRRRLLHARVLSALRQSSMAGHDPALLAHHADAAGDQEAVLEFASAAADQAADLHAYREAAAQYARALRFGDQLPAPERARLLEGRSVACYLSDQGQEALAARLAALDLWRQIGDSVKQGESLRWLSRIYWFHGQGPEAEEAALAALEVLEALPPGPELAMAYSNMSQLRMLADDTDGAPYWGRQAIALAEQLGQTATFVHALTNVGTANLHAENAEGQEELERSLRLALAHGLVDHAMRALINLAWAAIRFWRFPEAEQRLATAIAYATEHDADSSRWYVFATRGVVHARQGAWDETEAELRWFVEHPSVTPLARMVVQTTLGQIAARRGQPEAAALLDEALALADRTGQLQRLAPVRFARTEAALLAGDKARARTEAGAVRNLVAARGNRWQRGELAWLLRQTGAPDLPVGDVATPYAVLLAGDFEAAATAWQELGCPYDAACALAASDDPNLVRRSLEQFEALGAKPALGLALRRLRALGVRDLPVVQRGPRPSTRANPAGLTRREAEVLALVAAGLPNAEISDQLYLSPKTVSHHLSAIYAKLGVDSRTDAARLADQLGISVS
jgi:DNA-binding NarL/FixJ family response regulator